MAADALAVLDAAGRRELRSSGRDRRGSGCACELDGRSPIASTRWYSRTAYARLARDDDYREGVRAELLEGFLRDNPDPDSHGRRRVEDDLSLIAPSLRTTRFLEWWQRGPAGREPDPGRGSCLP